MLTPRQLSLLRFIVAYQDKHGGVSPSWDQMRDSQHIASKSGVCRLLDALEERGFVRRLRNRARAVEVLKRPEPIVFTWKGQRYRFISAEELAA